MDQAEAHAWREAFEEREQRIQECIEGRCEHWEGRPRQLAFPAGVQAITFDGERWNAALGDSGSAGYVAYAALLQMGEVGGYVPEEIAAFADAHGVKWRYVRPYKGRPRKSDGDLYDWHNG